MRGLIFDLDGTLLDNHALIHAAYADVFWRLTGRRFTRKEITALYGPDEEGIARRVVPERCGEALAEFFAFYDREAARHGRPFPGIKKLLRQLRARGIQIGLVTGRSEHGATMTLRAAGLEGSFDAAGYGSPEGSVKRERLRRMLASWEHPPGEVAYVGDSPFDMTDSIDAGGVPLGAAWWHDADPAALKAAGAAAVFRSPADLDNWIVRGR